MIRVIKPLPRSAEAARFVNAKRTMLSVANEDPKNRKIARLSGALRRLTHLSLKCLEMIDGAGVSPGNERESGGAAPPNRRYHERFVNCEARNSFIDFERIGQNWSQSRLIRLKDLLRPGGRPVQPRWSRQTIRAA